VQLSIITPERTVLEADDVEHVLLPAENGELGILPGHIAMVCSMQIGRIRVDRPGQSTDLAISGGVAEVLADRITVLAETAELAGEIDVSRAEAAHDRAREKLGKSDAAPDLAAVQAALARAMNRLRVARNA